MKTPKTITIEEAIKAGNDGQNQSIKSDFVGKHVYCNVGSLVEYCLKHGFEDSDSPVQLDELENYYSYPEWLKSVQGEDLYFEGGNEDAKNNFLEEFERLESDSQELFESEEISEETHERNLQLISEAKEEFEELEPEPQEVYEWWAVSDFLYERLKELGYVVIDTGSCYVWGRCTTGQAILLDGVITRICAEMEILEGQANSWAKNG